MSYILDALRRADAERAHGSVPGLNAQPDPLHRADAAAGAGSLPWGWITAGLLLCLMLPLAWYLGRTEAPADAVSHAAPPPALSAPQTPAAPETPSAPSGEGPQAALTPPPLASITPPPAPPAPPRVPTAAPPGPTVARAAPATGEPTAAARAPAVGERIPSVQELPPDVRRQLPSLSVGGSVYASVRADRLLILNGQPYQEGALVVQGVRLESIELREAVLSFKGQRFRISY